MKPIDTQAAQAAAMAPNSYHDFSGLLALKGKAAQSGQGDAALRAAAQQFEAMFLQEMMRTMREATIKSDLLESNAVDTFEGMFDKEVSMQMARRGGMGLADMMVQQMKKSLEAEATAASTQDMLRLRQATGMPLERPAQAHELNPALSRPGLPLNTTRELKLPLGRPGD